MPVFVPVFIEYRVWKKAKIRNRYNRVTHLTKDTYGKVTNTQESITYRGAKKSALSQPMTTRLHDTDKTIQQRQIQNKKSPQKKYRLGMVSKKITGGLKLVSLYQPHPNSDVDQDTYRCLVHMKDP